MSLIINIDTATENASIALCNDDIVLAMRASDQQKEHASFVHTALEQILNESGIDINSVDAVAVTGGPGSYTGLRVGMATAKGLCYALEIPLIIANTLQVMALAAKEELLKSGRVSGQKPLLCPMIDARRMEVFTATYDWNLNIFEEAHAKILMEENIEAPENQLVFFFGNGCEKLKKFKQNNFNILYVEYDAGHLGKIAAIKFNNGQFSDLAYTEPDYLKAFYTMSAK